MPGKLAQIFLSFSAGVLLNKDAGGMTQASGVAGKLNVLVLDLG